MITALDGSLTTINLTKGELDAIKERAAEFDAFLGKPLDGESMMRFIYQTPAIYRYTEGARLRPRVALILSLMIAVGLVLAGALVFRRLA